MHIPYKEKLKHNADFRVKYRFYTEAEGGRKNIPYQGIRCDFWYSHKEHKSNEIFMIWPEFEDINGNVIIENDKSVPIEGTARMWIVVPERRIYHRNKINIGVKGFFKEGNKNTGECEVIEILDLYKNPTETKK